MSDAMRSIVGTATGATPSSSPARLTAEFWGDNGRPEAIRLVDARGHTKFTVDFTGTCGGLSPDQRACLCEQIAGLINEHGIEVQP